VDFRRAQSLGLQLVNTLVRQLKGTIKLDRRQGTVLEVTFAA
jgi:two-component sensor histidine kinase